MCAALKDTHPCPGQYCMEAQGSTVWNMSEPRELDRQHSVTSSCVTHWPWVNTIRNKALPRFISLWDTTLNSTDNLSVMSFHKNLQSEHHDDFWGVKKRTEWWLWSPQCIKFLFYVTGPHISNCHPTSHTAEAILDFWSSCVLRFQASNSKPSLRGAEDGSQGSVRR